MRALASAPAPTETAPHSDTDIVREMKARIAQEPWAGTHGIVVQAIDGVLSLSGMVDGEAEKSALETMARTVEGVKGVETHLVVRSDVPYLYWV